MLTLVVGGLCFVLGLPTAHAQKSNSQSIETPRDAQQHGLDSLRRAVRRDKGVPLPQQLDKFVKSRRAAVQLGKALFWDMQVGSDGVQACASCHFHAGADDRASGQFNPDRLTVVDTRDGDVKGYFAARRIIDSNFETRQPTETITRKDFPLVRSVEHLVRAPDGRLLPGAGNSNDIVASMGIPFTLFEGVRPGNPVDAGTPLTDPIWGVGGRRVEPRNSPSVINAVFNFTNFWDGRANPHFNGNDTFGDHGYAWVLDNDPVRGLVDEQISLDNASLASQAMDPPGIATEMSFGDPAQGNYRILPEVGVKLLRRSAKTGALLHPLGTQLVDRHDSVLGAFSMAPRPGLWISYEQMIKRAFQDRYWNSTEMIPFQTPSVEEFTQMEANFSMFFGIAVSLYEATLVADHSPFDRWMETGRLNSHFNKQALAGLNLFVNEGECVTCHAGPELTKASVRQARGGDGAVSAMDMTTGSSLYDMGFYNIGVTPTTDDRGRGMSDFFGLPLAFSRQALFDRLQIADVFFPMFGNDNIPAKDENNIGKVCDDLNANGVCDTNESILPQFQRVAVDGAFKTPGLRNVELTGPYFHNGGVATLRQVVQFYNRGGNFCRTNSKDLHPSIKPLHLSDQQEKQLVAFLRSLTDVRVKYRVAPFDHPELRIPDHSYDAEGTRTIAAVGAWGSRQPLRPFLDLNPNDAIFTPDGECLQQ